MQFWGFGALFQVGGFARLDLDLLFASPSGRRSSTREQRGVKSLGGGRWVSEIGGSVCIFAWCIVMSMPLSDDDFLSCRSLADELLEYASRMA